MLQIIFYSTKWNKCLFHSFLTRSNDSSTTIYSSRNITMLNELIVAVTNACAMKNYNYIHTYGTKISKPLDIILIYKIIYANKSLPFYRTTMAAAYFIQSNEITEAYKFQVVDQIPKPTRGTHNKIIKMTKDRLIKQKKQELPHHEDSKKC